MERGWNWTSLERCAKIATWYYKEKSANHASWPRRDLPFYFFCSAIGEKFKPLVIGKLQMPQTFNKQLPHQVIWKANSKAWITGTIFLECLQKFNAKMQIENWKALILFNNAPCHLETKLSNVKLVFLPPNTTVGPSMWSLESYETLRLNIVRCFLNFFYPMKSWLL
jgi:hypothetical protein